MNKIRILYLEENRADIELVRLALHNHTTPSDIVIAENKSIFCSKLESEAFDIVLIDYDMPDFSAEEAIEYIKTKNNKLPIIVISGAIGYETAIKLIKKGADDYILKDALIRLPAAIDYAITENQKNLDEKSKQKTKNEALKLTQAGIFKTNIKGECIFVNPELCDMLGFTQKEIESGAGWIKYLHDEGKEAFIKSYQQFLENHAPFEMEGKLITALGESIWIKCNCIPENDDGFKGYIGTITNITSLKKTQDELLNLSLFDPLTNLPNRRSFENSLQNMIEECKRGQLDSFAVLFIDLDYFKKINDTLGHHFGDDLLKQAAKRFQSIIRKYDILARIGGDEFLVILKHIKSVGEIAFFADRFVSEFQVAFNVGGHECLTTLSIGIVYIDRADKDIEVKKVIQQADQALYRAKARGRNCYELFTEKIDHEIQHTVYIENALRHAIEKNELKLYFQPQIDPKRNKIFGFEVLARWNEGVYGTIAPDIFIAIAEETGQIQQIGEWIIDTALQSYRKIRGEIKYFQNNDVAFSINISAKQLQQKDFIKKIGDKIKLYHVPPENIIFELTETALIQNLASFKSQFDEFVKTGARIGVDDFGTGYSSFTNLKELPISLLKIDQSFVQSIGSDKNSSTIIKSIISLAKAMKMEIIAEGVETIEQVKFLMENDCHIFQGYYYAKPLPEKDIEGFIRQWENTLLK